MDPEAWVEPLEQVDHCSRCGWRITADPANVFAGRPRSYPFVPREEPTCRLCAVLDDLSILVHQLERETTLVSDLVLLLENIVRVLLSFLSYPLQAAAARDRRA